MDLQIKITPQFDKWLSKLKNLQAKRLIALRLVRLKAGHFGEYKSLGDGLYELKLGTGYRLYYTLMGETLVLLLMGGDKSTQSRDIEKAKHLLIEYRQEPTDEND